MIDATITATGSYKGLPAFEYEIREDGVVVGVDFVVLHPKEGETVGDLAAFVEQSFLPQRARAWSEASKRDRSRLVEARIGARLGGR